MRTTFPWPARPARPPRKREDSGDFGRRLCLRQAGEVDPRQRRGPVVFVQDQVPAMIYDRAAVERAAAGREGFWAYQR